MFDKCDENRGVDEQQQENFSVSDIDPLKRQQSVGIVYANRNPNQETNC